MAFVTSALDPRVTALLAAGWSGRYLPKMFAEHVAADPKIVDLVEAEITRLRAVPKGRCYASDKHLRILNELMAKHRASSTVP